MLARIRDMMSAQRTLDLESQVEGHVSADTAAQSPS